MDVLISNAETAQPNSSQSLATNDNCRTNIVEAVRFLIETLQRDMRASELDILDSAVNRPVFGKLKYMYCRLVYIDLVRFTSAA